MHERTISTLVELEGVEKLGVSGNIAGTDGGIILDVLDKSRKTLCRH